jgi:hypothetical protein
MGLNESLKTKEARSARRRGYYMQAKANEQARTTVEKNHGKQLSTLKTERNGIAWHY